MQGQGKLEEAGGQASSIGLGQSSVQPLGAEPQVEVMRQHCWLDKLLVSSDAAGGQCPGGNNGLQRPSVSECGLDEGCLSS
jgi:hypothetical protein